MFSVIDNETGKVYLPPMRKKQSAVRLGDALDARILALLGPMTTPVHEATISDVIRGAVESGLPALEKAYGIAAANMSDPMRTWRVLTNSEQEARDEAIEGPVAARKWKVGERKGEAK